jgi:hypothetical protein
MSASTVASKPASIWAASQQRGLAKAADEYVDVGEVPGGRAVEQREELMGGDFFRGLTTSIWKAVSSSQPPAVAPTSGSLLYAGAAV